MWHAVRFVVGVGEGPRPRGGRDADDGGGREGPVADERMGGGGDTDNGGMSKERVSACVRAKGRVGDADDGGRREECVDDRVCKTFTSQYPIFCVDLPACHRAFAETRRRCLPLKWSSVQRSKVTKQRASLALSLGTFILFSIGSGPERGHRCFY